MEYLFLVAALGVVGFIAWSMVSNEKETKKALLEYQNALREDSRVKALNAGRRYYKAARRGSITQTDEIQMMNDINARLHLK